MNKVYLIGNLTRDPEVSTTTSGISVCRMSIAVGRRFANAEEMQISSTLLLGEAQQTTAQSS